MQTPSADSVSAALARVFDRPEFAERQSSALLRLIADVAGAIRYRIASMLASFIPEQWHPAFTWLVFGLLSVLALWAVIAVARALIGSPDASRLAERGPVGVRMPAEDVAWWESVARAAAAAGRFRDAAVALYMAAVLRLDEQGAVRYHAGKTPGDYRNEIRSHPDARRSFDVFIRQFLPVAFGARVPDAASFQMLRVSAAELGVNG